MQYLARPGSTPYCTAQPLMVSLPPYETWAPPALAHTGTAAADGAISHLISHAPRLSEAFWQKHAPAEHCAITRPNEPIVMAHTEWEAA